MQEVESLCTSAIMIHKGKLLFNGTTDDIIGKVLGSNYLLLEAEPLDENLLSLISKIDGVEKVPAKTGRTVELKIVRGKEVRPIVAETVIEAGAKLYSMSYSENLLERTYIEALETGDGGRLVRPRVTYTFLRYEIKRSIARRKVVVLGFFTLLIGTAPYFLLSYLGGGHSAIMQILTPYFGYLWVVGVFLPAIVLRPFYRDPDFWRGNVGRV